MTNFDFLKNFNNELYEIGVKLEEDVINSPRAVTADATLFLENLVKDIYRQSNNKLEKNLISFYKKTDHLYRLGEITYIYKNKLQDAYNLRNKIHKDVLDPNEEKQLAFDLHKRLFYIAKKYFRDYCENERYIKIPEYNKPKYVEIHFDNCIICGSPNRKSKSNMCRTCNQKIENANIMLSLKNSFGEKSFTRSDLVDFGINESKAILLLMDLSQYDAITNKGEYYTLNPENFDNYLSEISQYVEIGFLITRFYKDEITADKIKKTSEYLKGSENKKPYREFYKLANKKIEDAFEENLLKYRDIRKARRLSAMDDDNIRHWYDNEKDAFSEGILNEPFILYNELLISEFFKMKKKGYYDELILKHLDITDEMYSFWQTQFMGGNFFKKSRNLKKEMILSEIKNNKSLNDALNSAKVAKKDFEKIYDYSKEENDEFYQDFDREYTQKRQKLLIKHLRRHNLNRAIKLAKISKKEFLDWYYEGEKTFTDFYLTVTELLMGKYIYYRKNDWDKKDILKKINITKDLFDSWSKHDEYRIFTDFENQNEEITLSLIKRGMIINGIKEGKGKEEAIFGANLTPREFVEIYNNSKREKTDFHIRFDAEYEKSRKKKFIKLIREEDFYCTIQQCEISQVEFTRWYLKDQDLFLATNNPTGFYLTATCELMDKYLKSRLEGKNKPDAAKSVGLSNNIVNKWLNHAEYDLFYEFTKKNKQVTIDLIINGFSRGKSKIEVSEISDIPLSTIEEYLELGKNGFIKYELLFELYEDNVIPVHLDIFLRDLKTKTFYRSLKHAKLSGEEIQYYYEQGNAGNEKFRDFSKRYLETKIDLYVASIMSRKSEKIALKNSYLTDEELLENSEAIEEIILARRLSLINDAFKKNKSTGSKLAKAAGISVEEIYDWYFRGLNGDERYREFSAVFELEVVIPRVVVYHKAVMFGMPEKFMLKKIKKDLGPADFRIWEKHDIFNRDVEFFDLENDTIDEKKLIDILENTQIFDVVKKSDTKFSKNARRKLKDKLEPVIQISLLDGNEAVGK